MHGTELRKQERRTLCLSAPRYPSFPEYRINASKRAAFCLLPGTGCS